MQFRELTERYQLQKILKSTRFGTVLEATDIPSGRMVTIKLVTIGPSPGLDAAAPHFEKLASTLAGLGHPNLPAVLDFGFTTDGSAFLAMERLEGKGLDALAGAPPTRLLSLVGQALTGLQALAGRGLAHHNVSPDNIFVVAGPSGERAVLLGLGTAAFRPPGLKGAAALGAENARFMAPELTAGEPGADWRADLFSLALTACHALGATVGFGESPVVQLPLAVSFELESDEALRQALERSLRQRPVERPTHRELREALRLAIGGPAEAAVSEETPAAPPAARSAATVMPFPPPARPAPPPPIQPPATAPEPLVIPEAWAPGAPPQPAASLSAAPPSSSAAPDFLLPDPLPGGEPAAPEPGDVLSAVDDEILNALLSVPAPPPRPAGTPAAQPSAKARPPTASAVQPPSAPAEGVPFFRRPFVLGAAFGLVVLGILATVLLLRHPQPQRTAPPPPPVVRPKLPTLPPIDRLQEAKLHLAQGEDLKARRVLGSISFAEQGLLAPEGCRELAAIQETLALAALERLPADLASGLKAGNLEILDGAVEAAVGQEASLTPEVRADLDRARGIVEAYGQARAAAARSDHAQVLERFGTLRTLLPKASDPEDLRGKAAQALETQAETLVQNASYAEALARLGPIQRTWPERSGLKERIALYDTYQRSEKEQETLLATIPNLERRKKPWDGLEAMKTVEPTPHLAPRFAEVRTRLEALLARLDQQPPQVVLRDGYLLEFARGTVAELSFRASDDYRVKQVKLMARPKGGKFRELPMETTRTGYSTVTIPPSFHNNDTVELYVTATDLSGHESYLGSAEKPLVLKRKQGFERLIG